MTWWPRCRSSAGRPWWSPAAAISPPRRRWPSGSPSLLPDAVLVRLPTTGHSVLDTRERAALRIAAAVSRGGLDGLAAQAAGAGRAAGAARGAAAGGGDRGGGHASRRRCPGPGAAVACTAGQLLHESDRACSSGRARPAGAEVGQVAAHRDVARRLEQRQAEPLGPDQLVELRWPARAPCRDRVRRASARSSASISGLPILPKLLSPSDV